MSWTEEKVSKLKELWGKGNTASQIAEMVDGKGGGKPEMAMAGGHNIKQLPKALEHIKEILNT